MSTKRKYIVGGIVQCPGETGKVVYLASRGNLNKWTEHVSQAKVFHTRETARQRAVHGSWCGSNRVVRRQVCWAVMPQVG